MRRRRMGRPGLVGTMARTAVVAGTASAVVGGSRNRQAAKQQEQVAAQQSQAEAAAMQAQLNELQTQQQVAPAAVAAPAAGGIDVVAELTKLADLKSAGVLSDDEFAAAKAKLLA